MSVRYFRDCTDLRSCFYSLGLGEFYANCYKVDCLWMRLFLLLEQLCVGLRWCYVFSALRCTVYYVLELEGESRVQNVKI